jgi:hypothetical protein
VNILTFSHDLIVYEFTATSKPLQAAGNIP